MCRIRRVPRSLDQCFQPLHGHFHWEHFTYFRRLVLAIAVMRGRRNGANRYRYLEVEHHRTRCNTFVLVERWVPEAALRQKAQERLWALHPQPGDVVYRLLADSKQATRGKRMDAGATRQDPTSDASLRGHPYVCGTWLFRQHVIPGGLRLSGTQEAGAALGVPVHNTTALAAPLIRECNAPAGVKVIVRGDADDLCPPVVKACGETQVGVASTLTRHRSLFTPAGKLKAGPYGRHLFRRRRTETLVTVNPHGQARDRYLDAGWLQVSTLGPRHVVFSRQGGANTILGVVTDDPARSAADLIRTDDTRWTSAPWLKDLKPLLGLGQDQNRPYRAAVIHRHLVGLAAALLTHLRLARHGAQGKPTRKKAADLSTAAAQDQLRTLRWEDLLTHLTEERHGQPVIQERARLRVA